MIHPYYHELPIDPCYHCRAPGGSFLILPDGRKVHQFARECEAEIGYDIKTGRQQSLLQQETEIARLRRKHIWRAILPKPLRWMARMLQYVSHGKLS